MDHFRRLIGFLALLLASPCALAGTSTRIYFDDFDGGRFTASGINSSFVGPGGGLSGSINVQGYSGYGEGDNRFSGKFHSNWSGVQVASKPLPTRLTLTNLPEHSHISIGFLLGIMDGWEGSTAPPGPSTGRPRAADFFNVRVDGRTIFSETFDTWYDGELWSVPPRTDIYDPSYKPAEGVLLVDRKYLGFGLANRDPWRDSAFNMYREPRFNLISHTSSSLTVEWFASGAGWFGGRPNSSTADEAWGIDNLEISLHSIGFNAVPEPSSLLLTSLTGSFLGLLWLRRSSTRLSR